MRRKSKIKGTFSKSVPDVVTLMPNYSVPDVVSILCPRCRDPGQLGGKWLYGFMRGIRKKCLLYHRSQFLSRKKLQELEIS